MLDAEPMDKHDYARILNWVSNSNCFNNEELSMCIIRYLCLYLIRSESKADASVAY